MAHLEPEAPKTIVVSKKLLYFFVLIVLAQIGLFAFGFYRNLNPQKQVEYVDRPVLVGEANSSTVTAAPQPRPGLTPLPDLPPLPKGFGPQNQPNYNPDQVFQFDPVINNPLEETLLKDARTARVKSDMRAVAVKLGETLNKFPHSVHAQFQLADMYEAMGIYDKAVEYYEKVFTQGSTEAGALYKVAAQKLKEGFYKEREFGELMAIGTIHQFQNPNITKGQDITITIPILSAPTLSVDADQVSIDVKIFDKSGDLVVPSLPSNEAEFTWSKDVRDWVTNGEEYLIAHYYIPEEDANSIYNSLEPRKYYGYAGWRY